ncbi:hypothetical protein RYX36_023036 [Vicia faba]
MMVKMIRTGGGVLSGREYIAGIGGVHRSSAGALAEEEEGGRMSLPVESGRGWLPEGEWSEISGDSPEFMVVGC